MGFLENWALGISVALIAIAFVVLCVFLILFLQSLRFSLKKTDKLLEDVDATVINVLGKLESLDPYFCLISKFGKKHIHSPSKEERQEEENILKDVLRWACVGVFLWKKIKNRR